jgi:nicotinamide-nucleotide amidase
MPHPVAAEIIAIGTEILLGEITDTNSVYLAQKLRGIGVNVYFMTSVGDNEGRIASAITHAMQRANVVITCGGLGPTIDDVTRQAVARATHRSLVFHEPLLDKIAERFAGFRAVMTENNRRQAYLPDGAILIENPVGTAPAFAVDYDGKLLISLPGVPREMKYLMENSVIPLLRGRYGLAIIKAHVLRTAGIGESMLDEKIGVELLEMGNPTVGLAAHSGQVDVRITAKAETEAEADAMIAAVEQQIRARIGEYVYGVDSDTLEAALAAALEANGAQLAVVEAGVPGSIQRRMERAGKAGLVSRYEHYESPMSLDSERLGAPGDAIAAVLEEPERTSMRLRAEKIARALAGEHTVGIAVLADPDRVDDHADQDEGSAFAVVYSGRLRSRAYGFGGQSELVQQWSGTWALAMAWQLVTGGA